VINQQQMQGMRRQAPTAGRLAAAMATICARRLPIRDRKERNSEFKWAITFSPATLAQAVSRTI
jgi:hypothetical protein